MSQINNKRNVQSFREKEINFYEEEIAMLKYKISIESDKYKIEILHKQLQETQSALNDILMFSEE